MIDLDKVRMAIVEGAALGLIMVQVPWAEQALREIEAGRQARAQLAALTADEERPDC